MKTNMKLTLTILSLIFTTATAMAQSEDLIASLKQDELQTSPDGAIMPISADAKIMRSLSIGVPPSYEGMPGQEPEPDRSDLLNMRYETSTLIRRAMTQAESKPSGLPRIHFYEQKAAQIIKNSGALANEQATRIVLNRTIDVAQTTIKSAGNNTGFILEVVMPQFYRDGFEIALAYTNNPPAPSYAEQGFPRAEFGIYFARFLWANQAGITSNSFKAITMIKLLGYLGQDLNSDLRRRKTVYREALVDIHDIQTNEVAYENILESLKPTEDKCPPADQKNETKRKCSFEPESSDLAGLRVRIDEMLKLLPH